ncbi:MAG: cytochrome c [Flavobacteriia bacterium]|nr:cytochrome c [Flavobacteriia bacterium]
MKRILSLAALLIFIVSCGGLKLTTPTQMDVERMESTYPDLTVAKLIEGKGLYEDKCSRCHGLKDPIAYTPEQWQRITPNMANKARGRQIEISAEQEETIMRYLVTMSSPR